MLRTLLKRQISLFLIPLAFSISCTNLVDDSINTPPQITEEKIVYISGRIDSKNAQVSSQLQNIDIAAGDEENQIVGRSAMPLIAADSSSGGSSLYEYFVRAETSDGSLTSKGTIDSSLNYNIGLKSGYTWKITAGIRLKAGEKEIMTDFFTQKIDDTTLSFTDKIFYPQVVTGADKTGSVDLPISIYSSIKKVTLSDSDSAFHSVLDNTSTARVFATSIPAGIYTVTINFLDINDILLYSVKQTINVFPYIETDKWIPGTGSGSAIDSSGNFSVNSALIQKWERTVFYVAEEKLINDDKYPAPADSNDGSAYSPLATITGAISKINDNNIADAAYTVYVVGTIKDNVSLSTTSMASITISKLSGKTAVVDGNSTGTVFDISTTKPVMFKGITIQNGQGTAMYKGGGISLSTGGTVYIEDCHLISNKAQNGGAIYIGSSSTMELAGNVYIPSSGVDENDIYLVDGTSINLTSALKQNGTLASVTLASYSYGNAVLSGTGAGSNYSKFAINNDSFGNVWTLNNEGKLSPLEIMIKTGSEINSALPWNSSVPFEASSTGPEPGTTMYYIDTAGEHVPVWYDGSSLPHAVKYYAGGVTDGGGGKLILNADSSEMFSTTRRFTSIDLSYFDTSQVTNASKMFYGCSTDLTMILVDDSFDLSSVTSSTAMFSSSAANLKGGLGTSFNSSKTDASYARVDGGVSSPGYFTGTKHLKTGTEINNKLFAIDAYNKTAFERSLTPPDASIPKSDIIYLDYGEKYYPVWSNGNKHYYYTGDKEKLVLNPISSRMFDGCGNYTTIDLSGFDTSQVTNMSEMFATCNKLTELDLSDFDTSKVTDMSKMFYMPGISNTALTKITVSSRFVTTDVTESDEMFKNCALLIGGNGTTYDPAYIDKTYARLDEPGLPGYFTAK